VPRRSLRPSHRRTDEYQLVRDQLSGILVPASRIVRSDVEGLRGLEIGDQFAFDRRARVSPSYEDLRGITPAVQKYDPIAVSGGEGGFPYEEEEWLPSDLDGLVTWVDQDALAAVGDGASLTVWDDLSDDDDDIIEGDPGAGVATVQQVGTDEILDPIWEAQFGTLHFMENESNVDLTGAVLVVGCTWRFLSSPYGTSGSSGIIHAHEDAEFYLKAVSDPDGSGDTLTLVGEALTSASALLSPGAIGTATHYTVAIFQEDTVTLRYDGRVVINEQPVGTWAGGSTKMTLAIALTVSVPTADVAIRSVVVANELPSDEEILLLESHLRYRARS
jgi:hypothetical protein